MLRGERVAVGLEDVFDRVEPDELAAVDDEELLDAVLVKHGKALVLAHAFATSIDSFAVGLTLPLLPVDPIVAVTVIGAVTFVISLIGGSVGQRLGTRFGRRAGIAGGVVLIGIGTEILISHLSA